MFFSSAAVNIHRHSALAAREGSTVLTQLKEQLRRRSSPESVCALKIVCRTVASQQSVACIANSLQLQSSDVAVNQTNH